MNIFIWTNFNSVYSPGLAFAIAKNESKAKRLIVAENGGREPFSWGTLEVLPLKHEVARCIHSGD